MTSAPIPAPPRLTAAGHDAPPRLREASGRNLHERIANTLGERIVSGAHPPGRALPTEIELCTSLSVSRSALREAFKLLAAKRLIISRQKVGTLVRPRSEWNMLDPEVLAWTLRAAPTDAFVTGLFEVRKIIEPSAAALAAERRSPEGARRIEQALADMFAFQDGSGDLTDADLRFHQAILEATGNRFIGALGGLIKTALIGSFRLGWQGAAIMQESRLLQHRAVLEAIGDRDVEGARARMAELLRDSAEDVRRSLREAEPGPAGS
jgi:DNA-binding FadR family transcriptional regulator